MPLNDSETRMVFDECKHLRDEILKIQDRIALVNSFSLPGAGAFAIAVLAMRTDMAPWLMLLPLLFLNGCVLFVDSELRCVTQIAGYVRYRLSEVYPYNWEYFLYVMRSRPPANKTPEGFPDERWTSYGGVLRNWYLLVGFGCLVTLVLSHFVSSDLKWYELYVRPKSPLDVNFGLPAVIGVVIFVMMIVCCRRLCKQTTSAAFDAWYNAARAADPQRKAATENTSQSAQAGQSSNPA